MHIKYHVFCRVLQISIASSKEGLRVKRR